jgi:hypothetical protein
VQVCGALQPRVPQRSDRFFDATSLFAPRDGRADRSKMQKVKTRKNRNIKIAKSGEMFMVPTQLALAAGP